MPEERVDEERVKDRQSSHCEGFKGRFMLLRHQCSQEWFMAMFTQELDHSKCSGQDEHEGHIPKWMEMKNSKVAVQNNDIGLN